MKKLLIISTVVLGLTALTSLTTDLKGFCNYFENEQLDSCATILDNYFKLKEQVPISNDYKSRFKELDTLMSNLNKLDCVDTCFYRGGVMESGVMKTNPPMTDLFICKINKVDTLKYLLRVKFSNPTKVVFLRKWEY